MIAVEKSQPIASSSPDSRLTLGPAMSFVLKLARLRATSDSAEAPGASHVARLWELAERYHPEETWLADSWRRGDRTIDDLERTAPRQPIAEEVLAFAARSTALAS